MVKKYLKWTVYGSIVALLIFGGVIRTQAKADQEGTQFGSEPELENLSSQSQDERGAGGWSREEAGRNEGSSGNSQELYLAAEEEHDLVILTGVVTGLDSESLWIEMVQGGSLEITGRAWLFIQEAGLTFAGQEEVELEGFYENEEFEVSAIWNISQDTFLQIRDESGRPLWRGGKR